MTLQACEVCQKAKPIMLDMDQGTGGPYKLCVKCWLEGIVTRKRPPLPAPQPSEPATPRRGKGKAS